MINKKNEKAFFSVLKEVNSNLINCNVKYWLDAGLLLKHTRGQSLFPSSDIDFGVKSQEIKNLIKFTKIMNKKGYVINTIGSTPVIFEGLNLLKLVEKKIIISIDICIYYKIKNYLYRPNLHKPLKQNYFYVMMYIIFCKLNLFINKATLKSKKKIRIYNFFLNIFLLFYFRFTKTTQYVIPLEYLDKLKVIYIKRKKFLIPVQTLKYLEWRYGNNWKIPNKNWRLTDGNMVILNNLKVFLHFYKSSKTLIKCKKKYILPILPKRPQRSIFYFNKEELKKIKNTKVKPERY